jgi:hypothetical protein
MKVVVTIGNDSELETGAEIPIETESEMILIQIQ